MENTTAYSSMYTRLLPGRIRLIEVLDDTGYNYGLSVVKLNSAPKYGALSYTWGPSTQQKDRQLGERYEITLNGMPFVVPQNLHDALTWCETRVRRIGAWFWIDYICINQQDLDERASQVMLMRSIYERSYYIYAWLGLPDDDRKVQLGVRLMETFKSSYTMGLESADVMDLEAQVTPDSVGFPRATDLDSLAAWEGIAYMLGQPYWSRAWVYQEATTPVQVYFICGSYAFTHSELHYTLRFADLFRHLPGFPQKFYEGAGGGSPVKFVTTARGNRISDGKEYWPLTFINILENTRYARSSDPRDKVFAFVSLANDLEVGDIVVDYQRDLMEVYIDVLRHSLRVTPDLRILSHVCRSDPRSRHPWLRETVHPELPTWLPDWSRRASPHALQRTTRLEPHTRLYDASTKTTRKVLILGRELQIEGFKTDVVQIILEAWGDLGLAEYDTMARRWQSALYAVEPRLTKFQLDSFMAADVRTRWVTQSNDQIKTDNQHDRWDYERRKNISEVEITALHAEENALRSGLIEHIAATCHGRRLGISGHGRLGMFPAATAVGDRIVIFHGDDVPHVVRPTKNHDERYTSIGECFVDGLMDGEALSSMGSEHQQTQTLILV